MSTVKLVNQARQLLELLSEQESGKAYDLAQLGEHLCVKDLGELKEVARSLKGQGCVELIEKDGGSYVALRSMDFDPGLIMRAKEAEQKSVIKNAGVDLVSATPVDRGIISTKVEVAPMKKPEPKATAQSGVGELTIAQVLLSLAAAVEGSDEIEDKEKWPLVEKIKSVACAPSIQKWLKAPLKNMVD